MPTNAGTMAYRRFSRPLSGSRVLSEEQRKTGWRCILSVVKLNIRGSWARTEPAQVKQVLDARAHGRELELRGGRGALRLLEHSPLAHPRRHQERRGAQPQSPEILLEPRSDQGRGPGAQLN